jgi:hypothetical protein
MDWIDGDNEFSEGEIAPLLDGVDQQHRPPEAVAKLESPGLMGLLEILSATWTLCLANTTDGRGCALDPKSWTR